MNRISLIIKREYLTRVRKKSFLIMSVLGPLIFAAYILIPMYFARMEDKEEKTVVVIDESRVFTEYDSTGAKCVIPDQEYLRFQVIEGVPLETFKAGFEASGYYAILFIPSNLMASSAALIYSNKQVALSVSDYIRRQMEKEIEHLKLAANDIHDIERILAEVETTLSLRSIKWTKEGGTEETHTGVVMGVGYMAGLLIFFFIFFFGSQVMRGVIEEKVSRIIEVIVSSVKPFQLMMGKIIGVGLTGLTQFLIWIIFSFLLITGLKAAFFPDLTTNPTEQALRMAQEGMGPEASTDLFGEGSAPIADTSRVLTEENMDEAMEIFASLAHLDFMEILFWFVFYFVFGYLLYAAMFAVIGSAVDNETDTQQLIWPVILPLILGIYVMISAMNNPDSSLPFWFSLIPFTSPVVMMVRIPFGVPLWQVLVSGGLLVVTFIGMTWVAAKVYRTGILMYGKKNSWKEIWKWLNYKS